MSVYGLARAIISLAIGRPYRIISRSCEQSAIIVSCWRVKRHIEAVPAIDRDNRERELRQFGLTELLAGDVINRVRNLLIVKPSHSLGPRERGALAAAVKLRRLTPRTDHVQALLGLATGAQVLRMHIEAKRAAVKLRDAIVDKVDQVWRETRPFYCLAQRQHS